VRNIWTQKTWAFETMHLWSAPPTEISETTSVNLGEAGGREEGDGGCGGGGGEDLSLIGSSSRGNVARGGGGWEGT